MVFLRSVRLCAGLIVAVGVAGGVRAQDAYVPNQGSNDLIVFDVRDPSDRVTEPLGLQPHEGLATRDARYVFVSNRLGHTLSVFDTATRAEIDTDGNALNGLTRIAVGTQPHGIAVTRDGRHLLVANDGSNDVSVVDVASLSLVATVPGVGSAPHMIAIRPDGREAWVGNIGGGDVAVIDLERAIADPVNAVVCVTPSGQGAQCRIATGAGTEGIAFTKDGRTAYAANGGANTVSVIEVRGRAVIATLPVSGGPRRVQVSPDGARAYVTQLFGTQVAVIDTKTHALLPAETIDAVPGGLGMDFLADGSKLYVANFLADTITVIDLADTDVRDTIVTGVRPDSAVILPEEVFDVRFDAPDRMTWSRNHQADRYHVYRGSIADLPAGVFCLGSTAAGRPPSTEWIDPESPAPGTAWFYLVAIDIDGDEGIVGRASDGSLRVPTDPACTP